MRKLILLSALLVILLSCGKSQSFTFKPEVVDISDRNLNAEAKQIRADMESKSAGTIDLTVREGSNNPIFEVNAAFESYTTSFHPFGVLTIGSNYTADPDSNNVYFKRWSIKEYNDTINAFGNSTNVSLYDISNSEIVLSSALHFPHHTPVFLNSTAPTDKKHTISWNPDTLSKGYAYLTIMYIDGLLSNGKFDAPSITKRKLIVNNGSYKFTTKDLRKIPAGAGLVLKITQFNYEMKKVVLHGEEQMVRIKAESVATVVDVIKE